MANDLAPAGEQKAGRSTSGAHAGGRRNSTGTKTSCSGYA
jgi:hypothetical protein